MHIKVITGSKYIGYLLQTLLGAPSMTQLPLPVTDLGLPRETGRSDLDLAGTHSEPCGSGECEWSLTMVNF